MNKSSNKERFESDAADGTVPLFLLPIKLSSIPEIFSFVVTLLTLVIQSHLITITAVSKLNHSLTQTSEVVGKVFFPSTYWTQEGTVGTHSEQLCKTPERKTQESISVRNQPYEESQSVRIVFGLTSLGLVTPRSASRCLCCAQSCRSNGARSPGRCRRAPTPSPGTP